MMQLFDSMKDFLQYDFLLYAFVATVFLSLVCGLISPLIIARKSAFMGSAISHSTMLGLSISLALFNPENSLAIFSLTMFITLITSLFLAKSTYRQSLPTDSLIGIFYTSTMALGIIIHTLFSKNKSDLLSFLFGNILLLNKDDLILSCLLILFVIPFILLPFAKWIYMTFDEEGALSSGINTLLYHYLFFTMLTFVIVISIKIAGTILIETLLLVPGFFALSFSKNVKSTFILSLLFSSVLAIVGLILSNAYSIPSGPTLAVTQFLALVLSLILKKIYNILKS